MFGVIIHLTQKFSVLYERKFNKIGVKVSMKTLKRNLSILFVFFLCIFFSPVGITNAEPQKAEAGITLNFLTRHGSDIWKPFKNAFLASQLAIDNNVDNIVFWSTPASEWVTKAQTGQYDGGWGGGPSTFDQLAELNLLPEITDSGVLNEASAINETISGNALKRYNQTCVSDCTNDPVWIA